MAAQRGRPKKEIDYDTASKLARLGCTIDEIAGFLGIGATTLKRDEEFRTNYKKGIDEVKISLRRTQLKKAIDEKNTTMLIWLGKQLLGQSENPLNDKADVEYKRVSSKKKEAEVELLKQGDATTQEGEVAAMLRKMAGESDGS